MDQTTDNVSQFIEQLLIDKGLPQLSTEVHKQLVEDLSERLSQLINRRIIEAVPEESLAEFERLMDEPQANAVKIQDFINRQVPNLNQITINAMNEFRELYLGQPT